MLIIFRCITIFPPPEPTIFCAEVIYPSAKTVCLSGETTLSQLEPTIFPVEIVFTFTQTICKAVDIVYPTLLENACAGKVMDVEGRTSLRSR